MLSARIKAIIASSLLPLLLPILVWSKNLTWEDEITSLANGGAVLVADVEKRPHFGLNADKALVPASILKIATAAAALHYLDPSYRFTTEFRLSHEKDLYVVGRGDPYLVSEELDLIAHQLKSRGLNEIRNICLDDHYFQPNLVLHGTKRSMNPYDAYNGALCVNFNTVFVRIASEGKVQSAEPQTPLTHLAREIALKSGLSGEVRINFSESPEKCLQYAGELIKAFLEMSSIHVRGKVAKAKRDSTAFPLLYLHRSSRNLAETCRMMFKYSNNFVANQIFLALGAVILGPPATVEKSQSVTANFFRFLGLPRLKVEEGSGLSRRNRITANQMIVILDQFRPYRDLLSYEGCTWSKTGTLSGVKSMAGYIGSEHSGPLSFVIILNGKHVSYKRRQRIFTLIKKNLTHQKPACKPPDKC
jgi:D-alanyl-D-alanine carboxypeptidase/D-alanyl-D-alanine-endopeptidase (penicillin-binding protein 4)